MFRHTFVPNQFEGPSWTSPAPPHSSPQPAEPGRGWGIFEEMRWWSFYVQENLNLTGIDEISGYTCFRFLRHHQDIDLKKPRSAQLVGHLKKWFDGVEDVELLCLRTWNVECWQDICSWSHKHIQTGSSWQIKTQVDGVFPVDQSVSDSHQSQSQEVSMLEPTPEAQLRLIQKMDGLSSQNLTSKRFLPVLSIRSICKL